MGQRVVVVGAGPVGAVFALAAARRGFDVTLLEAEQGVEDAPRAATVHPSTLAMLGELGLMDDVVERGLVARYFDFWDRPERSMITRLDHDVLRDVTPYPFVVQIEQHKIVNMVLERLSGVDVRFGAAVTGVTQDANSATVHTAEGPVTADYVIGADGGRSTVRKALGIEFEGYTWPERFLVLTTLFDFQSELDCSYRNYWADPREWVNLFKVAGDDGKGRWRAVFPTNVGETDEEAVGDEGARARLSGLALSANPADQLVHRKLYNVHQRVAASFRSGRVFLAGDAAHVNNPIGGLGLNCGIHDAVELAASLHEFASSADEKVLDRYDLRRRTVNIEFVQQQTVTNKRRLEEKDPVRRKERLAELAALGDDPELELKFLMNSSLLNSVARAASLG
ncbi:NAD(P)/FAD-dependent oxidoreductase [Amycolatopsis sp. NPDC005232]|uniref:FAD-dependent oxidoreductase n=1 Tax=Amycolatopsis sp. NPDC005232 TaxID=3157027 RepID=UPI0033BA443C